MNYGFTLSVLKFVVFLESPSLLSYGVSRCGEPLHPLRANFVCGEAPALSGKPGTPLRPEYWADFPGAGLACLGCSGARSGLLASSARVSCFCSHMQNMGCCCGLKQKGSHSASLSEKA